MGAEPLLHLGMSEEEGDCSARLKKVFREPSFAIVSPEAERHGQKAPCSGKQSAQS